MNKRSAIDAWNRRTRSATSHRSTTHFANVNTGKPVWWLDIPAHEIFDVREPTIDLLLAERDGSLHHLRVTKEWLIENLAAFALRPDKNVISLELSALGPDRFCDTRPKSGRMRFAEFEVK